MDDVKMLVAHEKIKTRLYKYCKGIDQCDWELVRSCFADEHQHRHPPFSGSRDEFIEFASKNVAVMKVRHHSISNMIIELADDGLSATSEANFIAFHLIVPSTEVKLSFAADGESTDWIVAGIYRDRWVCQDGEWLIIERDASHSWERVEPSMPRPT